MKKIYVSLLLLLVAGAPFQASAQTIITVAGITTEGYFGDSGLAVNCQMHWPEAVALDGAWNIYIADADNNVIRKVTGGTGIITTVAGSGFESGTGTGGYGGDAGPASSARLNYPSGVAVDAAGNMYIADQRNNRVRKVDPTGQITTFAGTGIAGFMGDGGAAIAAQLKLPTRVCLDGAGNVYIADQGNHCIRKVDLTGAISTFAGTGGTSGFAGDGGPAASALLFSPKDMTFDPSGNMFIADFSNNRIRKIDPFGVISTYAGIAYLGYSGDGGPATAANLYEPAGIASDASGNIFFSDFSNERIRRIDAATGIITTFAGSGIQGYGGDNGPAALAKLNFPEGIAINSAGSVYIADKANNRIRVASATLGAGNIATAPGITLFPNPGDGNFTLSLASVYNEPVMITVSDLAGRRLGSFGGVTNQAASLTVSAPPGMYLISAVTAHNTVNEKLIIR